jgi:hypothetical protein
MSAGDVSVANAPGASAAPFGLVPSPTSDRKTDLTIDRFESRYRRLRKNVITSARLLQDASQKGGFQPFMAMLTLTYRSAHLSNNTDCFFLLGVCSGLNGLSGVVSVTSGEADLSCNIECIDR